MWGEQLRSIQKLGTRLGRLTTVSEIGQAICTELRQLVDYHNVRVYRVHGMDAIPVAWRGELGEYIGEFGEQLRVRVGQGITGWVAQHGIAEYLPDAAHDPRVETIPDTEPDLDESMILAPMRFDDRIIGVIVLSKLGLGQFTRDDLRYLEIYAAMAAQAMANADSTQLLRAQSERLARQLDAQRELMRATESILSTLDPRAVIEEIAERIGGSGARGHAGADRPRADHRRAADPVLARQRPRRDAARDTSRLARHQRLGRAPRGTPCDCRRGPTTCAACD